MGDEQLLVGNKLITNSTLGNGFDCPSGPKRGFTRLAGSVGSGIVGRLNAEFFNDGSGQRSSWFALLQIKTDLSSDFESTDLMSININGAPFLVTVEGKVNNLVNIDVATGGIGTGLFSETITIVVGESISVTDNSKRDLFVCLVGNSNCGGSSNTQIIGNEILEDSVTVELLNSNDPFDVDVTIESLVFYRGEPLVGAFNDELPIQLNNITASIDLQVAALPVINDNSIVFSVEEDSKNNLFTGKSFLTDSNLNISFSFNFTEVEGTVTNINTESFEYSPIDDSVAPEEFLFSYSSPDLPYECTLSATATIQVNPQPDQPTLVKTNKEIEYSAGINSYSFQIANSVDFEDNILVNGFVVVDELPSVLQSVLKISNCTVDVITNEPIEMVGDKFEFCISVGEESIENTNFTYKVLPPSGNTTLASEQGIIFISRSTTLDINLDSSELKTIVLIAAAICFSLFICVVIRLVTKMKEYAKIPQYLWNLDEL